jgi:hypothetical protein
MAFNDTPVAGTTLTAASIHSPNYAQGASGWSIFKDGSAEFQNVLVRGTITGSQIIGSTITGGTIVGGDFQSANFSNTTHQGFDLNANASADAALTPGNTIQIYSNFYVGPNPGAYVSLGYNTGMSQGLVTMSTGAAGENVPGEVYAQNQTPPTGSTATPSLYLQSPVTNNGSTRIAEIPPTTFQPGGVVLYTGPGTSVPSGPWAGTKGQLLVGSSSTDAWTAIMNNENSVVTLLPGLVVGDAYTPRSRMLISSSEILTVDGTGLPETLWLNESNTESQAGPIANLLMRHQYARDLATYNTGAVANTFSSPAGIAATVTIKLPQSGVITVIHKATPVTAQAGAVLYGDVIIKNTTQSTTPYTGSENNGWETAVGIAGPSMSASVTLGGSAGAQGGIMGNPGDTMVIIVAYAPSTAAAWQIQRASLSVIPSL